MAVAARRPRIRLVIFSSLGALELAGGSRRETLPEQAIDVGDDATGVLPAGKAFIDAVGGLLLESHVAVMARTNPGAVKRRPRGAIEAAGSGVDGLILPRRGMAGLAAGGCVRPALHVA